MVIESLF